MCVRMKAKLVSYSTEGLTPTQKSIVSKKVNGYIDKSNRSRYIYKREGIIERIPHIKITYNTFIIRDEDFLILKKELNKLGVKIKTWNIEINKI
jgi:hypothetical protein